MVQSMRLAAAILAAFLLAACSSKSGGGEAPGPVAAADAYSATEDVTLDVPAATGVLANDSASPGAALAAVLVAGPSHGQLTLRADGSFTYQPGPDHAGADAFSYRASDGTAESAVATAAIEIAAVNDAPVAADDAYSIDEDVSLVVGAAGGLLANDGDVDGDPLTASLVAGPSHGTLSLAADGSFTYLPAPDFHGVDSFTYEASDATSPSNAAQVTIAVASVNDAPAAQPGSASGPMDAPIAGTLVATDVDGDPLTFAVATAPAHGVLDVTAATGAFTYVPASGYAGDDAFTFVARDGQASSAPATFTLAVLPPTPPLVARIFPERGTTGRPLQLFGSAFGGAPGAVTVGGRAAAVASWTERYAVVVVPEDVEPGSKEVVLTTAVGSSAPVAYEVVPWIDAADPRVLAPGDAISLSGDAFGAAPGAASVDAAPASVSGWTNRAAAAVVPPSTARGRRLVSLATASGKPSNAVPVTVLGGDLWVRAPVPCARHGHTAVWTGTEMLVWGGTPCSDGWRYDPARDRWTPMSTVGAPSARTQHAAVWTGRAMVVWGGHDASWASLGDGAVYDPSTDTWSPLSAVGAPSARYGHTAVWTGTEMLVCGGASGGGRYDPEADVWSPMASAGGPSWRDGHSAIWTGTEMIVWGGDFQNYGFRYDPRVDAWSPVTTAGAPEGRSWHVAVWTGTEMIVSGGAFMSGGTATTARYDPALDLWRSAATSPQVRVGHVGAWTGEAIVVWGGCTDGGTSCAGRGGERYDPAADTWARLPTAGQPVGASGHAAVWTGTEVVVWGGEYGTDMNRNDGGRYAAAANAWTPIVPTAAPAPRYNHTAVWTGADMIVWGGYDELSREIGTGGRWSAASRTWTPVTTAGAPEPRTSHTAVWTDGEMIVWGGSTLTTTYAGRRYRPASDAWVAVSDAGAPERRRGHSAVSTGQEMIVWGGSNGSWAPLATGGRYRPGLDAWTATPATGAPSARTSHTAVWTGTEMIVWGGVASGSYMNTGARLDPVAGTWTATSLTNAPTARSGHAAVWTGTEMIVWGGTGGASGGRYDPVTNTWRPVSTTGAPSRRTFPIVTWLGTRMAVWGGYDGSTGAGLGDGALYDPATDTWSPMSAVDAPLPAQPTGVQRARTGVWTGTELLVWGGRYLGLDDPARYLP